MKSSEQFAIEWNLSKRTINDLCNKGKIPGAIKEGRGWNQYYSTYGTMLADMGAMFVPDDAAVEDYFLNPLSCCFWRHSAP